MTRAHKLGPGTLKIGETGTELDLSCQMTEVKITWDADEGDPIDVLCGDTIPGDDRFTATLEGTVFQDMAANGVVDFSWSKKGSVHKVIFEPTAGNAKVEGKVKIKPVDLGGEVGKKNTSDLSWQFMGEPTFTPVTGDVADLE